MINFEWKTAVQYTVINTSKGFLEQWFSEEDIKDHGEEILDQIICLFNYMSFSNE